jgi:hypothetical protein
MAKKPKKAVGYRLDAATITAVNDLAEKWEVSQSDAVSRCVLMVALGDEINVPMRLGLPFTDEELADARQWLENKRRSSA